MVVYIVFLSFGKSDSDKFRNKRNAIGSWCFVCSTCARLKYVSSVKMAAHEDSNNKPKCKTNVNNDRERDFVRVYKVKI